MQEFLSWERLSLHLGQFQISGICGMLAQVLLLDLFFDEDFKKLRYQKLSENEHEPFGIQTYQLHVAWIQIIIMNEEEQRINLYHNPSNEGFFDRWIQCMYTLYVFVEGFF